MKLLGTPFAEIKEQNMSTRAIFLGLEHDMSEVLSGGKVHFWVRQQLEDKIVGMVAEARTTGMGRRRMHKGVQQQAPRPPQWTLPPATTTTCTLRS